MLEALRKELTKGLLTEQHISEVFEDVVRYDDARFTHGWRTKRWGRFGRSPYEPYRTSEVAEEPNIRKWIINAQDKENWPWN